MSNHDLIGTIPLLSTVKQLVWIAGNSDIAEFKKQYGIYQCNEANFGKNINFATSVLITALIIKQKETLRFKEHISFLHDKLKIFKSDQSAYNPNIICLLRESVDETDLSEADSVLLKYSRDIQQILLYWDTFKQIVLQMMYRPHFNDSICISWLILIVFGGLNLEGITHHFGGENSLFGEIQKYHKRVPLHIRKFSNNKNKEQQLRALNDSSTHQDLIDLILTAAVHRYGFNCNKSRPTKSIQRMATSIIGMTPDQLLSIAVIMLYGLTFDEARRVENMMTNAFDAGIWDNVLLMVRYHLWTNNSDSLKSKFLQNASDSKQIEKRFQFSSNPKEFWKTVESFAREQNQEIGNDALEPFK